MKKNYILCVCAAAALMFASCQKDTPAGNQSAPEDPKQEESTPEAPAGDMNSITATTTTTKVISPDGVNVLWAQGDKIQLFTRTWNETAEKFDASWCDYNSSIETPSETATFVRDETNTNTVDNTSGKYLAIYYKGATVVTQSRDYYTQISINKDQVAKNGGDFVSTLLYAASEGTDFTFSHAVSYLKFTVDQNTTPFTKLSIVPKNASEYIVSRIKIDFAKEVESTPIPLNDKGSAYTQSSHTVSLKTDDAAAFAPGTYYIAINPGTYANGFELIFDNGGETNAVVNTPENVVIEAGQVADLGTIGTLVFPDPMPEFEPSLYVENGVNKGVVFWADPTDPSKAKAISGVAAELKWHTSIATFNDASSFDTDNSQANFDYVTSLADYQADKSKYAAVYFCESLGAGWHLPSTSELEEAFRVWSGCKDDLSAEVSYTLDPDKSAKFDALLQQCEGDTYKFAAASSGATWYWLGQANTSDKKIRRTKVASTYLKSAANATNKVWVRCVRDVELE